MFEQLSHILDKISIPHLNILFLLGLALFGGTIGGRLFQKLRIPQVVGYITIGIIIGESGLKIIGHDTIITLQPFTYFALGLIGFMIGGELKKEILIKYGKQFINIPLFEGINERSIPIHHAEFYIDRVVSEQIEDGCGDFPLLAVFAIND